MVAIWIFFVALVAALIPAIIFYLVFRWGQRKLDDQQEPVPGTERRTERREILFSVKRPDASGAHGGTEFLELDSLNPLGSPTARGSRDEAFARRESMDPATARKPNSHQSVAGEASSTPYASTPLRQAGRAGPLAPGLSPLLEASDSPATPSNANTAAVRVTAAGVGRAPSLAAPSAPQAWTAAEGLQPAPSAPAAPAVAGKKVVGQQVFWPDREAEYDWAGESDEDLDVPAGSSVADDEPPTPLATKPIPAVSVKVHHQSSPEGADLPPDRAAIATDFFSGQDFYHSSGDEDDHIHAVKNKQHDRPHQGVGRKPPPSAASPEAPEVFWEPSFAAVEVQQTSFSDEVPFMGTTQLSDAAAQHALNHSLGYMDVGNDDASHHHSTAAPVSPLGSSPGAPHGRRESAPDTGYMSVYAETTFGSLQPPSIHETSVDTAAAGGERLVYDSPAEDHHDDDDLLLLDEDESDAELPDNDLWEEAPPAFDEVESSL